MTSQLPRFWCLFLSCQQQKNTENGAAVTSLRSFLFHDDFTYIIMENKTSSFTDLFSMNISWFDEDLEHVEKNLNFTMSVVLSVVRFITLILGIIVHRVFYKLMKRLPGRAINQIIYPYMVMYQ